MSSDVKLPDDWKKPEVDPKELNKGQVFVECDHCGQDGYTWDDYYHGSSNPWRVLCFYCQGTGFQIDDEKNLICKGCGEKCAGDRRIPNPPRTCLLYLHKILK